MLKSVGEISFPTPTEICELFTMQNFTNLPWDSWMRVSYFMSFINEEFQSLTVSSCFVLSKTNITEHNSLSVLTMSERLRNIQIHNQDHHVVISVS